MTLLAYSFPISIYRFHLFRFTGIMNLLKKGSLLQGIGRLSLEHSQSLLSTSSTSLSLLLYYSLFIKLFMSLTLLLFFLYYSLFLTPLYIYTISIGAVVTMMSTIIIIVNTVTIISAISISPIRASMIRRECTQSQ